MDPEDAHRLCESVVDEVSRAVVADRSVLELVLTAVMARGHVLVEDVPGTGKTLTARSFAAALGLSFGRIQFTPDLLPADISGTYTFVEETGDFEFREGPIFANVVLADEINRASPKTQAALLEAMEEGQVTVEGETHPLPDPFFVIATQNPVESGEGTFPLPESQLDRFLVKTDLGYPDAAGERELLDRREARDERTPTASRIVSTGDVRVLQTAPEAVRVHDDIKDYIVDLVIATRDDPRVEVGISPRGTQRLFEAVRAYAARGGRSFVTPDHVKAVAHPVLDHRLTLTTDASVDGTEPATVIDDAFDRLHVPMAGGPPEDSASAGVTREAQR